MSTSAAGSLSTSNAGQSRLSSTEGTSNAPHRRSALGPFVFNSNGRTGIRTANHAAGLIGILQLAGAHPSGLVGTLGHKIGLFGFKITLKPSFNPMVCWDVQSSFSASFAASFCSCIKSSERGV
jgi:hypothetical protein